MSDDGGQWYCRVCGAPAPDYRPARGVINVVALPCGHEQPTERTSSGGFYRGLEYRPSGL